MAARKIKKVRLWLYQNNLSGNANGHFDMLELPVNSTAIDVYKYADKFFFKCFNIINLGIFKSGIGDEQFCPPNYGTAIPKKYKS